MKIEFENLSVFEVRKVLAFASPRWRGSLAIILGLLAFGFAESAKALAHANAFQKPGQQKKAKQRPRSSGPTITPSAPGVAVGQSITFTSSTPVTWSLSGAGALSNQTSTSVVYTAPVSVPPLQTMLGCPVMPNDTVFHTRVAALPVNSNNATWFSGSSSLPISFDTFWGTSYADSSTPTRTMKSYYGSFTLTYPNPGNNDLKREAGNFVGRTGFYSNPDHHSIIVQRATCGFSETYDDYLNGQSETCQDGSTGCTVRSGIQYSSSNYYVPPTPATDAAGLPLSPFVATLAEIKSGVINHALRFTSAIGYIGGNSNTGTPLLWPAATSNGCDPSICPNAPVIGARVRLKASFNISTFSTTAQVLLKALQQYGMVLADIGGNNAMTIGNDLTTDAAALSALTEIRNANIAFNANNFEFVDESSLEVAPNSYQVNPGNGYVTPINQVLLTATTSGGSSTTLPIAVQGVAIGNKLGPNITVQAGSYSWQIPYWVNPSSVSQTVNWSLTNGVGSITSAGLYTPPATVTGTASAVVHGVAAADSAATIDLYLTIIPGGSVGIDTGATTNSTVSGVPWVGNIQSEGGTAIFNDTYPGWKGASPLLAQYDTGEYTQGDQIHTVIVPNGNYDVSYLLGLNYLCQNCSSIIGYYGTNQYNYGPYILESNGQIGAHYWDIQPGIGYIAGTLSPLVTIPAKVTNNILYAAVRAVANDTVPTYAAYYAPNPSASNSAKYTVLSGVQIKSDTRSPRWTIDTQQQTTISSGQTLRPFYVVDWFTGVNDPVWSIVSGPPGATLSGSTLSFNSSSYFNGQPIVVQATDGTYTATATIYTSGGKAALGVIPIQSHYYYKRAITISHSNVSAADQTNFPVVISLSDSTLANVNNGGHVQNSNGYDIVFASDAAGVNRLNWETEAYDGNAGTWLGHVKIPTLSHTADTTIYVFYGNVAVSSDQSTPQAVWDSNYTGVYHMQSITASSTPDSTSLANNPVKNQSVTQSPNGKIGQAGSFGGSGSGNHFEFNPSILNAASGTISSWVNPTIAMVAGQSYGTALQSDTPKEFHFLQWSSYYNGTLFGWTNTTDYSINLPTSTLNLPVNIWSHIVYTWDQPSNTQAIYLNGAPINTITTAFTPYTPVSTFWLGTDPINQGYSFGGILDEVQFSKIARSAGWVATQYAAENSPTTFAVVGTETSN